MLEIHDLVSLRGAKEANTCIQVDARFLLDTVDCSEVLCHSDDVDDDDAEAVSYGKIDAFPEDRTISNVSANSTKASVSAGLVDVMRHNTSISSLGDAYSYKRYEMRFADTNNLEIFEATAHNTVPRCSLEHAPLFRILNAANSTPQVESQSVLTFSFQSLGDCCASNKNVLCVYVFASVEGQRYGSRVFAEDLLTVVPALFEDSAVDIQIRRKLARQRRRRYRAHCFYYDALSFRRGVSMVMSQTLVEDVDRVGCCEDEKEEKTQALDPLISFVERRQSAAELVDISEAARHEHRCPLQLTGVDLSAAHMLRVINMCSPRCLLSFVQLHCSYSPPTVAKRPAVQQLCTKETYSRQARNDLVDFMKDFQLDDIDYPAEPLLQADDLLVVLGSLFSALFHEISSELSIAVTAVQLDASDLDIDPLHVHSEIVLVRRCVNGFGF